MGRAGVQDEWNIQIRVNPTQVRDMRSMAFTFDSVCAYEYAVDDCLRGLPSDFPKRKRTCKEDKYKLWSKLIKQYLLHTVHSTFLVRDTVIYLPRLVPYFSQNFT